MPLHPPRALPICLDACFDHGTGWQAIPAARAFQGSGLRFSATGGGARIDPASGVLHVPTGRPHDGALIRVQARNEAGAATAELTVTVEDDGERAETVVTDRLEVDGVTFLFDRPVPVGHFISGADGQGDPFVVGPVRLLGYLPGPDVMADDRHVNGAMLNPACRRRTGFDSRAERNTYRPALNDGRRLPLDLAPGDRLMVCRSILERGPDIPMAENFVVLTCLAEAPFADSFRPPYSGQETPLWRLSDIRSEHLASLPLVGARVGDIDPAALAGRFARFAVELIPTWNRNHLSPPSHPPLYGRDVCGDEALPLLLINSNFRLEDKVEVLIGLVQRGIDRYGVFRSALEQGFHPWQGDGAHNSGRKASILIAGLLLGDEGMLSLTEQSASVDGSFHEDGTTFHVTQRTVDVTNSPEWRPPYRGDDSRPKQPYTEGMIGMPDWGTSNDQRANAAWTGNPYRVSGNHNTQHAQVLSILAMGLREAWGNEAYFDYHMRHSEIMSGRPDPWRFRGGTQALYDPVVGSRPPRGWEGWQLYWRMPLAWRMFDAYRDRFYRYPWT